VDLKGTESLVALKVEGPSPLMAAQPSGWPDRLTQIQLLEYIERAWDNDEPLSLQESTAKAGRYAPNVFGRRLQIDEGISKKLLEQWLIDEVIKLDSKWSKSRNKVTGFKKGPKPLPMSGLSAMIDRGDFVDDRRSLNQPTNIVSGIVDIVSDDDFG
jgi:hypothetical protein